MHFLFPHMHNYNRQWSELLINSIKKHMPDQPIVQLSDELSETLPGVKYMVTLHFDNKDDDYIYKIVEVYYRTGFEDILLCEGDMIFTGDMSELFDDDYEVSVCIRHENDGCSEAFKELFPYNIGFLVVKNRKFWLDCLSVYERTEINNPYYIGQFVFAEAINSGKYKVNFLDGGIYNRTPIDVNDHNDKTKMWHFKGKRKNFMLEWHERNCNGNIGENRRYNGHRADETEIRGYSGCT